MIETQTGRLHTRIFQVDGEFRFEFRTRGGDFTSGELDVLMHAVQWARRQLTELDGPNQRCRADADNVYCFPLQPG